MERIIPQTVATDGFESLSFQSDRAFGDENCRKTCMPEDTIPEPCPLHPPDFPSANELDYRPHS
jgi:hypothetical protein